MLVPLYNYTTVLTCDFPKDSTVLCLEDADTIFNSLNDGDYTYLRISNDMLYEVIKVTRNGDDLDVERAQCQDDCCDPEQIDFFEGDCVDYYTEAFNCDGTSEQGECPVSLESSDNSILIDETSNCAFDLTLNTDLLPSISDQLCELGEGTLLSEDYIVTLRRNGESCSLHLVPVSELCARLGEC